MFCEARIQKRCGQCWQANVLYTYELARRLAPGANTTVNALHPGQLSPALCDHWSLRIKFCCILARLHYVMLWHQYVAGVVSTNLGRYLINGDKWYMKPIVGLTKIFTKTPSQVRNSTLIDQATSESVSNHQTSSLQNTACFWNTLTMPKCCIGCCYKHLSRNLAPS